MRDQREIEKQLNIIESRQHHDSPPPPPAVFYIAFYISPARTTIGASASMAIENVYIFKRVSLVVWLYECSFSMTSFWMDTTSGAAAAAEALIVRVLLKGEIVRHWEPHTYRLVIIILSKYTSRLCNLKVRTSESSLDLILVFIHCSQQQAGMYVGLVLHSEWFISKLGSAMVGLEFTSTRLWVMGVRSTFHSTCPSRWQRTASSPRINTAWLG